MSSIPFETFLARLFADAEFREDFLRDPRPLVEAQGLEPHEQAAALGIDRAGLVLAARSFAAKRADKNDGWPRRALRMWRRIRLAAERAINIRGVHDIRNRFQRWMSLVSGRLRVIVRSGAD